MKNLINKVSSIFKESYEYHTNSTAAIFKTFISVVLVQFAVLSLVSISSGMKDVPELEKLMGSSHLWWGLLGLYGAASLFFEKYIKEDLPSLVLGYLSAIASFALLTYDFAASKPPIVTGGILTITASIFLGGLLYGRVKHRQV